MEMSEAKDLIVVTEPPAGESLPPPSRPAPRAPEPDLAERFVLFVELRPWLTAAIILFVLSLLHLVLLNVAGVADGLYVGDTFFFLAGSNLVEIALLAFIAYNVVLPTLLERTCVRTYDELRPSLMLDDRGYGEKRAGIVDPFLKVRVGCGIMSAVILTPFFGKALSTGVPPEGVANAVLTIWMYVRIAVIFGLGGANSGYIVGLHQRFRAVTGEHLRIDLFDFASLRPIARYGREASLYLLILIALIGPAIAQSDALSQSFFVFAVLIFLVAAAVIGAMLGARRSIRAAKKAAIAELSTYARELWRRAYAGQRVVEAVAIPALGAMIAVRNEIRRAGNWPGGWSVFARFAILAAIPLLSWFGGPIVARLIDLLGR